MERLGRPGAPGTAADAQIDRVLLVVDLPDHLQYFTGTAFDTEPQIRFFAHRERSGLVGDLSIDDILAELGVGHQVLRKCQYRNGQCDHCKGSLMVLHCSSPASSSVSPAGKTRPLKGKVMPCPS